MCSPCAAARVTDPAPPWHYCPAIAEPRINANLGCGCYSKDKSGPMRCLTAYTMPTGKTAPIRRRKLATYLTVAGAARAVAG